MSHCLNAATGCESWGFGGSKRCGCACETCDPPRLMITREQFSKGWDSHHQREIPSVRHHDYETLPLAAPHGYVWVKPPPGDR